ncbi:MAG: large subunit ribosomal protein L5 [Hyphomicrobiaceae bacterium]|jgi:large subunit ribosomal protein L5
MSTTKPRLAERYATEIVPALLEQFSIKSPMAVARIEKVVINIGLGDAVQNPKLIDAAVNDLSLIAGQRPVITKARKSIANFKLREGMPIGVSVTLRRDRMWEFLDRLINVALPRVRDFRGLADRGYDGHGNYTMGIREQIIFPEIDLDGLEKTNGMSITIVTSTASDEQARALLKALGMPFRSSAQAAAAA